MKKYLLASLVVVSMSFGTTAIAGTIYSNEGGNPPNGDCSFSTTCAATFGRGDEFAAQLFSLAGPATITFGSFTELDDGTSPTSVNYAIYADVSGLPGGAALFSGSSALTATVLGSNSTLLLTQTLESFGIGSASLGAGSYFFAIQAVSSNFSTYLQPGLNTTGAAESTDGGVTWAAGYENGAGGDQLGGIAVALYDSNPIATPEPITLSLFGAGLVGAAAFRRRKNKSA